MKTLTEKLKISSTLKLDIDFSDEQLTYDDFFKIITNTLGNITEYRKGEFKKILKEQANGENSIFKNITETVEITDLMNLFSRSDIYLFNYPIITDKTCKSFVFEYYSLRGDKTHLRCAIVNSNPHKPHSIKKENILAIYKIY